MHLDTFPTCSERLSNHNSNNPTQKTHDTPFKFPWLNCSANIAMSGFLCSNEWLQRHTQLVDYQRTSLERAKSLRHAAPDLPELQGIWKLSLENVCILVKFIGNKKEEHQIYATIYAQRNMLQYVYFSTWFCRGKTNSLRIQVLLQIDVHLIIFFHTKPPVYIMQFWDSFYQKSSNTCDISTGSRTSLGVQSAGNMDW